MALYGRVAGAAVLVAGKSGEVRIEYIDDGSPSTVIYTLTLQFGPTSTIQDLTDQIITAGKQLRAALNVVASFNANVSVGTVVGIP